MGAPPLPPARGLFGKSPQRSLGQSPRREENKPPRTPKTFEWRKTAFFAKLWGLVPLKTEKRAFFRNYNKNFPQKRSFCRTLLSHFLLKKVAGFGAEPQELSGAGAEPLRSLLFYISSQDAPYVFHFLPFRGICSGFRQKKPSSDGGILWKPRFDFAKIERNPQKTAGNIRNEKRRTTHGT